MLSTKQWLVILLAREAHPFYGEWVTITTKQLHQALRYHAGRIVTQRHIRRLLQDLEQEGVIERDIRPHAAAIFGHQAQTTRYRVTDLNKAFSFDLSDQEQQVRDAAQREPPERKSGPPVKCSNRHYQPCDAYLENYSPFYDAITHAELPPKWPIGDPRNYDRVKRANSVHLEEKRKRDTRSSQPQDTPDHDPAKSA
ncbi:hypothetical protein ES705_30534 [subsurface metagenome]